MLKLVLISCASFKGAAPDGAGGQSEVVAKREWTIEPPQNAAMRALRGGGIF